MINKTLQEIENNFKQDTWLVGNYLNLLNISNTIFIDEENNKFKKELFCSFFGELAEDIYKNKEITKEGLLKFANKCSHLLFGKSKAELLKTPNQISSATRLNASILCETTVLEEPHQILSGAFLYQNKYTKEINQNFYNLLHNNNDNEENLSLLTKIIAKYKLKSLTITKNNATKEVCEQLENTLNTISIISELNNNIGLQKIGLNIINKPSSNSSGLAFVEQNDNNPQIMIIIQNSDNKIRDIVSQMLPHELFHVYDYLAGVNSHKTYLTSCDAEFQEIIQHPTEITPVFNHNFFIESCKVFTSIIQNKLSPNTMENLQLFETLFHRKDIQQIKKHPHYQKIKESQYRDIATLFEIKEQEINQNMGKNINGFTTKMSEIEDSLNKQKYYSENPELGARLFEKIIVSATRPNEINQFLTHAHTQSEMDAFKPFIKKVITKLKETHNEQFKEKQSYKP